MPTENDTKKPDAVLAAKDAKITALEAEVAKLKAENLNQSKVNAALTKDLEAAKKDLKQRNTAPSGDYCVLRGKTYQIAGTVEAKEAGDQARKGNMELTEELVILKR